MDLKYGALVSVLKVVKIDFTPNEASYPKYGEIYFPGIKNVKYKEINQTVFGSKFISGVTSGDEWQSMLNLSFNRMIYLFIFCTTLFLQLLLQRVTLTSEF